MTNVKRNTVSEAACGGSLLPGQIRKPLFGFLLYPILTIQIQTNCQDRLGLPCCLSQEDCTGIQPCCFTVLSPVVAMVAVVLRWRAKTQQKITWHRQYQKTFYVAFQKASLPTFHQLLEEGEHVLFLSAQDRGGRQEHGQVGSTCSGI